ncbi:hypothetical protein EC973_006679 [Apophysomyces ossiformis]|uniref:peptide chain release factor N(5)-glutamine methyltransferase n=1 Tax=Apophysomyces ossiformis TaxID=679940 RepID=A0A8H7EQW2_9FUNG|nr:hypothetical protein EC973_006679 [Apophysomyces ossiformis]
MRRHLSKQAQWVRQLLPACEGDISLAKRQLVWLKEKVLTDSRGQSLLRSSPLTDAEEQQIDLYIKQRVECHKPLQYILGTQPFCELDIVTRPPVLIPRWETEDWTYRLIDRLRGHRLPHPLRVLDICTGTGCIALGLSAHLPKNTTEITGIDVSTDAIELANHNRIVHADRLRNPVSFQQMDAFKFCLRSKKQPHLIVSNPPYITAEEYAHLDKDVKDWEDKRALVADEEGTSVHKRVIKIASQIPETGLPRLVMEMGINQAELLTEEMSNAGFKNIEVWKDLADRDRVILGE